MQSGKYKNWQEITPLVNKELFGDDEEKYRDESAFRKSVKYARDFYEAGVFGVDDDYYKELEVQRRELEKERQKLFATKTEYTRTIRQQSRFELFYENVRDCIKTLDVPEFVREEQIDNDKEFVLSIADIHAGAFFDVITNNYSFDECTRRFNYLTNHMIDYIVKNQIQKLNVICLGDDVQGILRLSDLQLNESTVVQATVYVSKMISKMLNTLSTYCDIDYYHVPTSNHSQSRPIGTKASELASEDVEYIIGNYIKDVLENNDRVNVHLNFGYEYIEIPIFDFKAIAMHGHQINNIENAIRDISFENKTFYEYLFVAHFHGGKEIVSGESDNSDIETLICPSFIGTCPYAKKIGKGAKPACKVFVFDEKYGHVDTHKIILN